MLRGHPYFPEHPAADMLARLVSALAGRYEIERELGRGGMATVYLAHDVRHDRRVAIKVLDPELGSSVGPDRFLREIATAARLTHPNILTLHDSGDAAGLLYYVMPYVRGESLRRRLDRERQLPIDDALALARQVASALDYAHDQGVVHRDIKPENILMGEGGQAIVADFGLARVLHDAAAGAPLTGTGLAVGTPAYMSPEQASADRAIDARTDIYSLACVVYEMIAGLPPFRGATVQAIVAHHLSTPAPSLCIDRESCPESIDLAVRRALSKTPADRFRSAGEFVRAMDPTAIGMGAPSRGTTAAPPRTQHAGVQRTSRSRTTSVVGGVALLTIAAVAAVTYAALGDGTDSLDPSKIVVVPLVAEGDAERAALAFHRQLTHALGEWDGLVVATTDQVRDAMLESGDARRADGAIELARRLGAGRLVRGTLQHAADSIVVSATSYDVRSARETGSRELTYAASAPPPRDELRRFANRMLRERDELPLIVAGDSQRPKLAAWLAYDAGRAALDEWNLAAAEARLREAVGHDGRHAQAQLWLAQTLTWRDDAAARGDRRHAAGQAAQLRSRLVPRDGDMAAGLLALAESRYLAACDAFRDVLTRHPRDFAALYGLGDCQTRDPVVIDDPRSPSRFAFRGSMHSGVEAYVRSLEVLPGAGPDFAYERLSQVLRTQMNQQRAGYRVAGDTVRYGAYPALLGDTIAYVPYSVAALATSSRAVVARAHLRALEQNRSRLRDRFAQWVRVAPDNPRAHEMLGRLLETMGDIAPAAAGQTSALTATRTARALAADSLRKLGLASDEVRLLLKNEDFSGAAALADSLLAAHPTAGPAKAERLLGLAALTGRLHRTAELLGALSTGRHAPAWEDGRPMDVPPVLVQRLAGPRAAAMLGVCNDSVRTLQRWIHQSLVSHYAGATERERVAAALTWRPMSQAASCLGVGALRSVTANDRLLALQQAAASGGVTAVRAEFNAIQAARRDLRPGDVAIDYTFHEAWVLAAVGDSTRAAAHLDRSLGALSTLGTFLEREPAQAAGLVRAMLLRARLADAQGDVLTARRWAGAVTALWGKADVPLRADVDAMRALAAGR